MTQPLIRQGEGHNAYHRIHQERTAERQRFLRLVEAISADPNLLDQPATMKKLAHRSAPADPRRLRAIPVIAPSITGTIPGTDPPTALIAAERKKNR